MFFCEVTQRLHCDWGVPRLRQSSPPYSPLRQHFAPHSPSCFGNLNLMDAQVPKMTQLHAQR